MTKEVERRGRPSKFDGAWEKVVEMRLDGQFIPAIAKNLGISRNPIYTWLDKGKHDDQEKKYQLFLEKYKEADSIATMKDLDEFDEEISQMAPDTPEFNKYMDTKSRVKERRNRLHGGGGVNVNVVVKQKFTGW